MATLVSTVASLNACHVHQHDDSSRTTLISQYLRNPTPDREAESYIHPHLLLPDFNQQMASTESSGEQSDNGLAAHMSLARVPITNKNKHYSSTDVGIP